MFLLKNYFFCLGGVLIKKGLNRSNEILIAGIFGEIVYSLVGDGARHFNVDPDTGVITVLNATFLDRERQAEITFSAVASDKAPITTRKSTTVPVS